MIPIAPEGVALESYVNVLQYLRGRRDYPLKRSCIVWRAREFAEEILGGTMSLLQVLMRFTVLPLILETLHESSKKEVIERISANEADAEMVLLFRRLKPKSGSRYKRCPRCIIEDLRDYGFSFGRTLHQFASIRTCPSHDVLLEEECSACGAGFEFLSKFSPYRGELQVCRQCGAKNEEALSHNFSNGYVAFAKLFARGLEGNACEVGPQQMKVALDRFSELSLEHDVDLLSIFAEFWACKDWRDVCKDIGAKYREIRRALILGVPPVCVISTYVVASFFNARIASDITLPNGPASCVAKWKFRCEFPEHWDIRYRAHEFGMPMRVIYWLLVGDWAAVRKLGYALKNVRKFVSTLEHWQQLAINARRTIFLGNRLSRLNINSGKLAKPPGILVKSAGSCTMTELVRKICELLGFSCQVEIQVEVLRESPVVFCDGTEMKLWGSSHTYDFVIQRTQYWPQLKTRTGFLVPHVWRPSS